MKSKNTVLLLLTCLILFFMTQWLPGCSQNLPAEAQTEATNTDGNGTQQETHPTEPSPQPEDASTPNDSANPEPTYPPDTQKESVAPEQNTPDTTTVPEQVVKESNKPEGGIVVPPNPKGGPLQFLTWDGGSGPSKKYWNIGLKLEWKNQGTGDFLDAKQAKQGKIPYQSVKIPKKGTITVDTTVLVKRWVDTGKNRGFYLIAQNAHGFVFAGRTATDAAQRPKLLITTDTGTFDVPCLANANWSPSSFKGYDSRASFKVNNGNVRSILLFDLSKVKGTVKQAKLSLTCTYAKYESNLRIFEADPPIFRVGGGGAKAKQGLAAGYPNDQGIKSHKSVLFASDFSDVTTGGWGRKQCNTPNATLGVDPKNQYKYMRGVIKKGRLSGSCSPNYIVTRADASGVPTTKEKELYARYYVYLEKDWGSTVDANKMPGWDVRMGWWNKAQGGYWQSTTGNGGAKGTGLKKVIKGRPTYEGHSVRGHGGSMIKDGNYYKDYFWIGHYIYHINQPTAFGESVAWPNTIISREKWFCIEQYIKMNTIQGPYDKLGNGKANKDGVLRVWVDGVLAYERTNLSWTRHPELNTSAFWFNWYHGGTRPTNKDMHYRMSSFVVAREYIGPRVDK